jgi:hypothetical protein
MDLKSFSANAIEGLEFFAKATDWKIMEPKLIAYLEGCGYEWCMQKRRADPAVGNEIENVKAQLIDDPKLLVAVKAAISTAKAAG